MTLSSNPARQIPVKSCSYVIRRNRRPAPKSRNALLYRLFSTSETTTKALQPSSKGSSLPTKTLPKMSPSGISAAKISRALPASRLLEYCASLRVWRRQYLFHAQSRVGLHNSRRRSHNYTVETQIDATLKKVLRQKRIGLRQ